MARADNVAAPGRRLPEKTFAHTRLSLATVVYMTNLAALGHRPIAIVTAMAATDDIADNSRRSEIDACAFARARVDNVADPPRHFGQILTRAAVAPDSVTASEDVAYNSRVRFGRLFNSPTTGAVAITRMDNISNNAIRFGKLIALMISHSGGRGVWPYGGFVQVVRGVGIRISVATVDNVADSGPVRGHVAACLVITAARVVDARDGIRFPSVSDPTDLETGIASLAAVDDLVDTGFVAGIVSPAARAILAHLTSEKEAGVHIARSRVVAAAVVPTSAICAGIHAGRS